MSEHKRIIIRKKTISDPNPESTMNIQSFKITEKDIKKDIKPEKEMKKEIKKEIKKEMKHYKVEEVEIERLIDPDEHKDFTQSPEFSNLNIESLELELDKCTDELENLKNSTDSKQIDKIVNKRIKLLETKITQMNSQKNKILSLTKKINDTEFYSEIDLTIKFKTSEPDPSLSCFIKGKTEIDEYKPLPATLQKQQKKLFANKPLPKSLTNKVI